MVLKKSSQIEPILRRYVFRCPEPEIHIRGWGLRFDCEIEPRQRGGVEWGRGVESAPAATGWCRGCLMQVPGIGETGHKPDRRSAG